MTGDLQLRLELRTRGPSISPGLALRVFDPAWLLARQWTFGEFDGADGGTPVVADLEVAISRLASVEIDGQTIDHDPAATPLDVLVERRPGRRRKKWTVRERVDVGLELLHALREHGLDRLRAAVLSRYGLAPATPAERLGDPEGAELLDIAVDRLPDGARLYADAGDKGGALTGVPPSNALEEALGAWRAWIVATLDEPDAAGPGSAWQPQRLEHSFAVTSPSRPGRLVASAQRGDLDWHSFDTVLGAAATTKPERVSVVRVPTPVRFRGMPASRLWELEDASIDLGAVDAAPSDIARMALLEFALVYGNDVFALPVRVPVGSISSVESLVVSDTFGTAVPITSALRPAVSGRDGWAFHALSGPAGPEAVLLVPHAARHALRGPALEESTLMRDEMANLVWAIERRFEGGAGRALVRAEEEARSAGAVPTPAQDARLAYRLQTSAPPSWFPLVLQSGLPRLLALATLAPSTEPPRGELLPVPGGTIFEEEVPRDGVRLVREAVLARWCDGSTRTWVRARRAVGRGEGSSGLSFDLAEPAPP